MKWPSMAEIALISKVRGELNAHHTRTLSDSGLGGLAEALPQSARSRRLSIREYNDSDGAAQHLGSVHAHVLAEAGDEASQLLVGGPRE